MTRTAGGRLRLPELVARSVTAAALLVAAVALGRALMIPYSLERGLWLARISGWTAATALLLSLSMSPASRAVGRLGLGHGSSFFLSRSLWPSLRRAFGVAAAVFTLLHAAIAAFGYLGRDWRSIPSLPYLRAGLVALAILLPLLATSFPRLTRGLGVRLWKPLHRLAYVAALLVLQHLLLSPFAPRRVVIGLFAGVAAFGLLRLIPPRRASPDRSQIS